MIEITLKPTTPAELALIMKLVQHLAAHSAIDGLDAETAATAPDEAPAEKAPAKKRKAPATTGNPEPSAPSAEDQAPAAQADAPSVREQAAARVLAESAPARPATVPTYTLEQVRAKLVELSGAGKRAEVQALVASYGVTKLTDIPADKFADVMAKAETI